MTDHPDDPGSTPGPNPPQDTAAPALPDLARARVTDYVYDPETFAILCRPGQRLTQRKAARLRELGLFEHVVIFAK